MEDLPQASPIGSSNTKNKFLNIEYGFGGIILGAIFVVLSLLVLNYFNVISFSSILPKNISANLPQRQNKLEKDAEKVGYQIAWQGDSDDTTGRTILLSKGRGLQNTFFIDNFDLTGGNEVVMGTFKNFQKISGSNDIYLSINNPLNKDEINIRIKAKSSQDKKAPYTDFTVDNLSVKPSDQNNFGMEKLFDFTGSDKDIENINKIVKAGDVVRIWLNSYVKVISPGKGEKNILKDERGVAVASHVSVRRFSGKKEINKELLND